MYFAFKICSVLFIIFIYTLYLYILYSLSILGEQGSTLHIFGYYLPGRLALIHKACQIKAKLYPIIIYSHWLNISNHIIAFFTESYNFFHGPLPCPGSQKKTYQKYHSSNPQILPDHSFIQPPPQDLSCYSH